MNTVRTLINKELKILFNSWGIYIGYILFFCICGLHICFSKNNIFYIGQATMLPIFVVINWTQFFLIPALTMRSIADEKRNGMMELMLTKPIRTAELIRSKFFSYLIVTTIAILLTIPYYITIAILGNVDHGSVLLGYFGLICMSACYISIGIFASSLSHTPITSFAISFGISLWFQLLAGAFANRIANDFIVEIFMSLSMEEHFDTLSRGILDSRTIVYFCSICAIFLSLSKFFICKNRF